MQEIVKERTNIKTLLNLEISKEEVADILHKAGFVGYRFDGALEWIIKAMEMSQTM